MLGFRKKQDFPVGEYEWLTVVSPEGPGDLALVLEPNANPAARTFQQAMFAQGVPLGAFQVTGISAGFERLKARGVTSIQEPRREGR